MTPTLTATERFYRSERSRTRISFLQTSGAGLHTRRWGNILGIICGNHFAAEHSKKQALFLPLSIRLKLTPPFETVTAHEGLKRPYRIIFLFPFYSWCRHCPPLPVCSIICLTLNTRSMAAFPFLVPGTVL